MEDFKEIVLLNLSTVLSNGTTSMGMIDNPITDKGNISENFVRG